MTCSNPGTPSCTMETFNQVLGDTSSTAISITVSGTFYMFTLLLMAYMVLMILIALASGKEVGMKWVFISIRVVCLATIVLWLVGAL